MSKSRAPSQRQLRVGELIRHELSTLFMRGDIADPDIDAAGVTVLEVVASPDLRIATAYVRPFQPEFDPGQLVRALTRHRKFIRGQLAPRLKLKFMPEIRFKVDTASEHARSIDRLLADPSVARDIESKAED